MRPRYRGHAPAGIRSGAGPTSSTKPCHPSGAADAQGTGDPSRGQSQRGWRPRRAPGGSGGRAGRAPAGSRPRPSGAPAVSAHSRNAGPSSCHSAGTALTAPRVHARASSARSQRNAVRSAVAPLSVTTACAADPGRRAGRPARPVPGRRRRARSTAAPGHRPRTARSAPARTGGPRGRSARRVGRPRRTATAATRPRTVEHVFEARDRRHAVSCSSASVWQLRRLRRGGLELGAALQVGRRVLQLRQLRQRRDGLRQRRDQRPTCCSGRSCRASILAWSNDERMRRSSADLILATAASPFGHRGRVRPRRARRSPGRSTPRSSPRKSDSALTAAAGSFCVELRLVESDCLQRQQRAAHLVRPRHRVGGRRDGTARSWTHRWAPGSR